MKIVQNVPGPSQEAFNSLSEQIVNVDHKVTRFVSATVNIGTIAANAYASGNVEVTMPEGTNGVLSVIPRYTSIGFPIAGAYQISGASPGKAKIIAGVYNFTSSAVQNVTATVDVVFLY